MTYRKKVDKLGFPPLFIVIFHPLKFCTFAFEEHHPAIFREAADINMPSQEDFPILAVVTLVTTLSLLVTIIVTLALWRGVCMEVQVPGNASGIRSF